MTAATLADFGLDEKELLVEMARETMAKLIAAEKTIERLKRVLEPFVTAANDADGYPDNHHIGCDPCMSLDGLTVGDLRRARSAHGT